MHYVTQTKVTIKDKSNKIVQCGNCWASCIASILELPLSEVPNVETLFFLKNETLWWDVMCLFVESKGYELYQDDRYACFHIDHPLYKEKEIYQNELKDSLYIGYGLSARGINHAVVCKNGEIIWDPYPTREGIDNIIGFESIIKINI